MPMNSQPIRLPRCHVTIRAPIDAKPMVTTVNISVAVSDCTDRSSRPSHNATALITTVSPTIVHATQWVRSISRLSLTETFSPTGVPGTLRPPRPRHAWSPASNNSIARLGWSVIGGP